MEALRMIALVNATWPFGPDLTKMEDEYPVWGPFDRSSNILGSKIHALSLSHVLKHQAKSIEKLWTICSAGEIGHCEAIIPELLQKLVFNSVRFLSIAGHRISLPQLQEYLDLWPRTTVKDFVRDEREFKDSVNAFAQVTLRTLGLIEQLDHYWSVGDHEIEREAFNFISSVRSMAASFGYPRADFEAWLEKHARERGVLESAQ